MQYIYQAYIGNMPISSRVFYRTIDGALQSAIDLIEYQCDGFAIVCKPVEIEKPQNYPYWICKVFRVKIIDDGFDEELGVDAADIRYDYILIKEATLMD